MSIHADSTSPGRRAPTIQNRKVPIRRTNAAYRSREYLAEKEVETLMESAASVGRHGKRDAALILVAYRHGLRVSELVSLRWDQVDLRQGLLHVTRRKHGIASVHPLRGPELRALRRRLSGDGLRVRQRTEGATYGRCGAQNRLDGKPVSSSRCTRTCYGTPPAISWPTTGRTHGRSNITWAIATSSTPPAIPNSRRIGSRTSGEIDAPGRARRKFRRLGLTPRLETFPRSGRARPDLGSVCAPFLYGPSWCSTAWTATS
jgi:Phage integrase family